MKDYMVAILSVTIGVVSLVLTYVIRYLAFKHKVIDVPNERSSHTIPTPRGGGLAIVICWFTGLIILFIFGTLEKSLLYALLCGILLAIVSLADDLINLKPEIRFTIQIITTTASLYFLFGFEYFEITDKILIHPILVYPILIVGIVWFINLFNFLDGIDAYASNEAITILLFFLALTLNEINLILIASIAGFLFWNWPKAKIFMGDVGSTQLGFVLAILGIYFSLQKQITILDFLLMSSVFWFDATYTLYRRWRNKEKLSQAHRKHAYQRLVQMGFSHKKVNLLLIIVNIIIFLLIIIYKSHDNLKYFLTIFAIIGLFIIYKLIDKKVPF